MNQILLEIDKNVKSSKETDRIMWFSMWAILSIASFGIAWFPMIYFMIKRRNDHFSRQKELELLTLTKFKELTNDEESPMLISKKSKQNSSRNAIAWTISTLLIFPAFFLFYNLKKDLQKHEKQEHDFFAATTNFAKKSGIELDIHGITSSPIFPIDQYVTLNIISFGLAAAYWLFRIFNDYNNHFKIQWKNEAELLGFLKKIIEKSN